MALKYKVRATCLTISFVRNMFIPPNDGHFDLTQLSLSNEADVLDINLPFICGIANF